LQVHYDKYEAEFQGIGPSGTVEAKVGDNSVFLKVNILVSVDPVITLQDLHIERAE
jgi:hypothetical protein